MSNLEPGDLAIVTKSLDGHAVGKIVECVQIDYVGHPQYGTIWLVKSSNANLVTEYGGVGDNAHMPQDWLKKIPKDPLPDEEDNLTVEGHEVLTV
jgi:hypothetical protein